MSYRNWSPTTRILVLLIGIVGLVWLIVTALPLIQVLIVTALVAYLFDPLVVFLMRRARLSRRVAAQSVYLLFLLLLAAIPAALSTVAITQINRFDTDLITAVRELSHWLAQPIVFFGFRFQPLALLENVEQDAIPSLAPLLTGRAWGAMQSVTTNLLWALTALVSLYYLLLDGPRIKPLLVSLTPEGYQAEIRRLLDEVDQAWRLFLRAQLIIFAVLTLLLVVSGVLIVWLYRAGLLPLSPVGLAVLLVGVYALVQQVDNIWLRPYFFSAHLDLHPGVVFVSLIGALALGGVLAVIIIVPILATAKIVGRYVHRKLLNLPPWPIEPAPPENVETLEGSSVETLEGSSVETMEGLNVGTLER